MRTIKVFSREELKDFTHSELLNYLKTLCHELRQVSAEKEFVIRQVQERIHDLKDKIFELKVQRAMGDDISSSLFLH